MDREVIDEKLESLRRCVERIRQKTPSSAQGLMDDADAQDIVTLNLTRAVQLCVDIGAHLIATQDLPAPGTMGQTFDALAEMNVLPVELAARLKKAVGFRNIAVHNYEAIDWTIAHAIATRHIEDFTAFATRVAAWLP